MRQAGRKAVSLLLAAQMLGGPVSQAVSLSPEPPFEELPLTSSSPAPEPTTNTGGLEPEITDVVTPEPTETEEGVPPEEIPVEGMASPAPTEDIPPEEPTQEEPSEETETEEKKTEPEIINLLEQMLQAKKTTALMVTHDVDEAVYLSDRVIVMSREKGHLATA